MAKQIILAPTSQQIAKGIAACPTQEIAVRLFNTAISAGKVDYQKFATDILPTVEQLRLVGGFHVSSAGKLRQPGYEKADSFDEQPELMVALVRIAPNRQGISGLVYYATAPLMFNQSASYRFVGESIDLPGMAANNPYWQTALVGKPNPTYSPNAQTGMSGVLRWLVEPVAAAGTVPKAICASLGESDVRFRTVDEMITFLNSRPTSAAASAGLGESDLMALFGLS